MHLESLWNRETGLGQKYPSYSWLLKLFSSGRSDRHLILGDIDSNTDIETVAGTAVKFCEDFNLCDYLAVSDEDGILYILDSSKSGPQSICSSWSIHKNAIFDIEWLPGVNRIVAATGHQYACLVDVATQQTIDKFKGHNSSLKTIASRRTDPFVFATGGRDGTICIWDQRVNKRDNSTPAANEIRQAHSTGTRQTRKSTSQSITGLCFQDEFTLISTASNDGSIKVWDLRRSYKTQKTNPIAKHVFSYHGKSLRQVGYSGLTMDHSQCYIYVNCIDDTIYKFSTISYKDEVIASYNDHKNKTFFVKSAVSPDDRYLLTGSSDNQAVIYDLTGEGSKVYHLQGHTEEVTALHWHRYDIRKLATLSDDDSLLLWKLGQQVLPDQVIGHTTVSISSSNLTRIREKRLATLKRKQTHSCGSTDTSKNLPPWPVIAGLDIKPKLSSPKKLLISPRKATAGKLSPSVSSANALSHCPSSHVKRRLETELSIATSPAKKTRTDSAVQDGASHDTSNQTLSPIRINNSSRPIVNITPTTSVKAYLSELSSPTANLPNSVLDPQTPHRYNKENSSKPKRRASGDWLSQYSLEKRRKLGNSPEVAVNVTATTPKSSTKLLRSNSKTPTSARKKNATTLMAYFSPSSATPKSSEPDTGT